MHLFLLLAGLFVMQVPEPPGPAMDAWQVPPGCPDRAGRTRAIERRLGRALAEGEVRLNGTIVQHAAAPRFRLRLELSTGGRSQTGSLSAARCASLVDGAALLVVLALREGDPPIEDPPVTAEDPPEVIEDPGPVAAIVEPAVPVIPPAITDESLVALDEPGPSVTVAPRRAGGLVRVHGGVAYGAVPGVTGAVGLAAGVLWRRARLEVAGLYLGPRTETLAANSVRVSLLGGAVLGCGRLGRGRLEVPLCGGLEVAAVRAVAAGPGARSSSELWLAGVVSGGVTWHLGPRLGLTLALQGLVHIYGPRFELQGPGPAQELFRPQPVSGRLLFGLEARLGDPW